MRHGMRKTKLGRSHNHQIALRRNLAFALIRNGKITTTLAKAKLVQPVVEKLITMAKKGAAAPESEKQRYVSNLTSFFTSGQNQRTFEELGKAQAKERKTVVRKAREAGETRSIPSLATPRPVEKLLEEIAPAYASRDGGYTRIMKLGHRLGDNAQMAILSLV